MASDLNVTTIIGRLVRDCEIRYSQSGIAVCNFSIANNESKKDQSGQYQDEVNYFDCVMLGKYAESMSKYLMKGTKIAISGRLKQDRWQDKQTGQQRSKVSIKIETLSLIGGSQNNGPVGSNSNYDNNFVQQPQQGQQFNQQYQQNNLNFNNNQGFNADPWADNNQNNGNNQSNLDPIPF